MEQFRATLTSVAQLLGDGLLTARPAQHPFRGSVCAVRTLNATGQSRVGL